MKDKSSEDTFIKIETDGVTHTPMSIPREVRNLQTSYNDAETIFKDVTDEHEHRKFSGFALATEEVEYASEPTTFQEAWHHPNPTEREGWRHAIKKEFHDMMKAWSVEKSQVQSSSIR